MTSTLPFCIPAFSLAAFLPFCLAAIAHV